MGTAEMSTTETIEFMISQRRLDDLLVRRGYERGDEPDRWPQCSPRNKQLEEDFDSSHSSSDETSSNENGRRKSKSRSPQTRRWDEWKLRSLQASRSGHAGSFKTIDEIDQERLADLALTAGMGNPIEGKAAFTMAKEQRDEQTIHLDPWAKVDYFVNGDIQIAPSRELLEQKLIFQISLGLLCKTKLGSTHLEGKEHIRKVEEHAAGTGMGGATTSMRRHNHGEGYAGRLCIRGMMNHWGDALMSLPKVARDVHAKHPITLIKKRTMLASFYASFALEPKHVQDFEMAAASYNGCESCGKYMGQTLVEYNAIEDDVIAAIEGEQGNMDICPLPSEGNAWWPVTILRLTAAAQHELWEHYGFEPQWRIVICWHHLMERPIKYWIVAYAAAFLS